MGIAKRYKNYVLNLVLIWLAIFLYRSFFFYKEFLREETQILLLYFALSYTIIAFFYYTFVNIDKIKETKGSHSLSFIKKIIKNIRKKEKISIEKEEKTAVLFILVKFFFLPIMINFFFQNLNSILKQAPNLIFLEIFSINGFNQIIFPFIVTLIFLLDTLWFSFGYVVELKPLKNTVRSVEPTLLGWIVTLICYPPFNMISGDLLGWYSNEFILVNSVPINLIIKFLVLFFLFIYVSATFALGTKCSNLTNRGIIARGPYAIIRHPAYFAKNMVWWITLLPVITLKGALVMGLWSLIYHFRSLTEENHLSQDTNYVEYCHKVKYRYIPGVY